MQTECFSSLRISCISFRMLVINNAVLNSTFLSLFFPSQCICKINQTPYDSLVPILLRSRICGSEPKISEAVSF